MRPPKKQEGQKEENGPISGDDDASVRGSEDASNENAVDNIMMATTRSESSNTYGDEDGTELDSIGDERKGRRTMVSCLVLAIHHR